MKLLLMFGILCKNYFIVEYKVRIMQVRNTLQTLKKGSISTHKFVKKIQEIVDSLVTNAQAITKVELVNHVIDGLGYEFDLTIIHITSTIDFTTESITLANVKFVLQKYEQRLQKLSNYYYDFYW